MLVRFMSLSVVPTLLMFITRSPAKVPDVGRFVVIVPTIVPFNSNCTSESDLFT